MHQTKGSNSLMADLSLIRSARATAIERIRTLVQRGPRKTFILGVGAQKAGTSWMFRYLERHPECAMGPIKEHAVFSTAFGAADWPGFSRQKLLALRDEIDRQLAELAPPETPAALPDSARLLALLDQVALERDPERRYLQHFDRLLADDPARHLTGDITPAYSMLDAGTFARIRAMLVAGGYQVRVVFLMRDPVERCYSMVRMADRNAHKRGRKPAAAAHLRFATEAVEPWCEARTRYDQTIRALEQVFAPDELCIRFYESFITEPGIADLTRFLGISYVPPVLDHRENTSPREAEPSAEAVAKVRAHYAPVYDYCIERFGLEAVQANWPHAAVR